MTPVYPGFASPHLALALALLAVAGLFARAAWLTAHRRRRLARAAAAGVTLLTGVALAAWPSPGLGADVLALVAAVALVGLAAAALPLKRPSTPQAPVYDTALHATIEVQPISGLPTRQMLEERLAGAAAACDGTHSRLALLVLDLDGFRTVNDDFGHPGGDTVLRETGRRLAGMVHASAMVAQIAGDEFVALLTGNPSDEDAAAWARQAIERVGAPFTVAGREVTLSCSVGIATYPEGGAAGQLIAHADAAAAAAKRMGGGCHCFYTPALTAHRVRTDFDLVRDLRVAMEHGQLELFYQPKIDARSGRIMAAEALMRWRHPTRGLVPPIEFIPLAERFGLITSLGNWVIEEACRQLREWRDAGLRMRVAVNLSAMQMRQADIAEQVYKALKRYRIHPALLTCEITESVAMEDTQSTQATFRRLGAAGVHVSIDDFGTGYSSLGYLRQLPARELKIDRSFVMDVDTDTDARAVVDAVVKLAHALGLKVVAEGVETPSQHKALVSMGCDALQGYLFARPMSARALLLWALDDKPRLETFQSSLFDATRPSSLNVEPIPLRPRRPH